MIQNIVTYLSSFIYSKHTWTKMSSSYTSVVERNLQFLSARLSICDPKIYFPKMFAKNIYRNDVTNCVPDEGDACIKISPFSFRAYFSSLARIPRVSFLTPRISSLWRNLLYLITSRVASESVITLARCEIRHNLVKEVKDKQRQYR